jgi:hypothetical protein
MGPNGEGIGGDGEEMHGGVSGEDGEGQHGGGSGGDGGGSDCWNMGKGAWGREWGSGGEECGGEDYGEASEGYGHWEGGHTGGHRDVMHEGKDHEKGGARQVEWVGWGMGGGGGDCDMVTGCMWKGVGKGGIH